MSLDLPFDTSNPSVGFYLDETAAATGRFIYFATSHGIYMWKEGQEADAREIYASDGTILLQSFTGARMEGSKSDLMLSFMDTDQTACGEDIASNDLCGYVHVLRESLDAATVDTHDSFVFARTAQRGFRVASSRNDSDTIYVTGHRGWPSSTGTQVWVGSFDSDQTSWEFELKFRQYPVWDADKLDYSGVGLDVGYWDGGYYRWMVKPNDSQIAGGTGNFFLHVVSTNDFSTYAFMKWPNRYHLTYPNLSFDTDPQRRRALGESFHGVRGWMQHKRRADKGEAVEKYRFRNDLCPMARV